MQVFIEIEGKKYLHPFLNLMLIFVGCSFVALTINFPSIAFGFDIEWQEGSYLVIFGIIGILIMFISETIFIYFTAKPLTIALRNSSEAANKEPNKLESALVRTINLPIISIIRVAFVHTSTFVIPFLILISWGIKMGYISGDKLPFQKQILMAIVMAGGGTVHVLLEYFLVQHKALPYFKLFMKNLDENIYYKIKGKLFNTSLFVQIIIVFTMLLIIPVCCLIIGFYFKAFNMFHFLHMEEKFIILMLPAFKWGVVYSVTSIIISVFVALLFSKNIQSKAQQILNGLKLIENGEFQNKIEMYSTDEFKEISLGYNQMAKGLIERDFIKDTFGKYIPVEIRDKILEGHLQPGGEEKYATVLFCDIRNFTSFSERHKPQEVVKRLNEHFTEMVKAITKNGGVVDKFIGDAIMATFGVTLNLENHEQKAVESAIEMMVSLSRLNKMWQSIGLEGFNIGIGIHSGLLVAGNIGSDDRKDYTCIGDTVNLASRIESFSKEFPIPIIISRTVRDKIKDNETFSIKPLKEIQVKGREKPIEIFGIVGRY